MSLSIQHPQSYPAALLKKRCTIPSHLNILVERPSVHGISSSQQFNYDVLNKSSIEAHFQRNVTSSFISLYESEDKASRKHPHTENARGKPQSHDAVMVDIDTRGMTPAWISVENDEHIPVWFEEDKRGSEEAHHGEILWFCLEEVKVVLRMDDDLGDKGEWLACGFVPQSRLIIHSRSSSSKLSQRVFNDEKTQNADGQARRERIRTENERLRLDQQDFEHAIKQTQSSRSLKTPPSIPTRKSSLSSLGRKAVSEPKKEARTGSKISCTTRNARISVTNADPHSAASLMKYAISMAHGKRLEGEETWLSDATSSVVGLDRAGSTRTIEYGLRRSKPDGFTDRDMGVLITPPNSPKGQPRRHDTHERRRRENGEDLTRRHEVAQHGDDQLSHEERRRIRRSAAPSPSQSMLGPHLQGNTEYSLRSRRSRRELLLELQSDEDSVLREYAQVSLQDPIILQRVRNRSRYGYTDDEQGSQAHDHGDSQSLVSLRNRLATSTSSVPALVSAHNPPPSHGARDEAHGLPHVSPRASSLYSTMTSLASLSTFEHASVSEAVCVSVEPTSQVREVEIVRSLNESGSGSGSRSSGRRSSGQNGPTPRLLELQEEAQAEAVVVPSPTYNPWVQSEQQEGRPPSSPQLEATPKVVSASPAPVQTPMPVLSKGEAFLARAKCLGEKGREITSRIAEIRERQSKTDAKKDKWGLSKWRSGEKKEKHGNRRIGEQDE